MSASTSGSVVDWRYVDRMRAAMRATMPLDTQVVLIGVGGRVVTRSRTAASSPSGATSTTFAIGTVPGGEMTELFTAFPAGPQPGSFRVTRRLPPER